MTSDCDLITLNSTTARRTHVLDSGEHGTVYVLDDIAARPMNYCSTCGARGGSLCSGKRGGYLAHPHRGRVLERLGEAFAPVAEQSATPRTMPTDEPLEQMSSPLTLHPPTLTRRMLDAGLPIIRTSVFGASGRERRVRTAALVEVPSPGVGGAVLSWARRQGYRATLYGSYGDVLLERPATELESPEPVTLGICAACDEPVRSDEQYRLRAGGWIVHDSERCPVWLGHAESESGERRCTLHAGHVGAHDARRRGADAGLAEQIAASGPVEPVMLAAGDLVRGAVVLNVDGSRWFGAFDLAPITLDNGRPGVRVWPTRHDLDAGFGSGDGARFLDLDAALRVPVDAASVD